MADRWGIAFFLGFLILLIGWTNWNYWRSSSPTATFTESFEQQIVADLSNLPPKLGDSNAPVLIEVTIDPHHAGPCGKGTVEFIRQLVRDYPGKVRANFHKVARRDASCAAHLLINGQKTFTLLREGKPFTVTLHGIARPGDPMSFLIRQIVEQEIAKASKGGEERRGERKVQNGKGASSSTFAQAHAKQHVKGGQK